ASSFLSLSQFVKAVGSMVAPYLATFFALQFGDWKLLLLAFGGVSLLSVVWLHFTKITETPARKEKATLISSLKLLGNGYIALMVLGIFFVVGLDVGINSSSGQFLMEKMNIDPEPAKQGRSLYFFGKTLGTFLGALLLTRLSSKKFLLGSSLATFTLVFIFIYSSTPFLAVALMFIIGLAASNIFPLIFSITVSKYKQRSNEISGLMIMAVSGGAIIPPFMGGIADLFSITAGMYVLVLCTLYLLFVSIYSLKKY
ncbi:MAG: MFS transporter, partial [Tangfeifania sp.]